jgi:two-component system, cell cycle sensor histidine kinase and response regulator CckA
MELRQFVETANAPIIGIDENGLVNEWNQMAVQITGFTKREVVGRELVADFITEEYKASVWEVLAKALTGEETANFEFPLYTKDEKRVEVLLNASSRRNIEGQIVGVLGVGQDITEIRAKEAAERRAGRMEVIGQFTGGMAHDFNNLLTIVQGNISLVVEDAEHLDDTAREILDDALSAAKDGSNLTRQLLAFARNQRLESMEVNVNVLILRLSRLITRTISKSMDLVVNLHPNNPTAHVDLSQLESAILNLCLNGRDAMNSEGTLVLSTDIKHFSALNALPHDGIHPGNYIEISVKDTGAGMSKEMMALAFEPFYTTKKEGLGSGLGLSMVQSFAIQSKGSVSIVSEEGTGTEVTLLLPMLGQLNPASVVSDDPPPSPAIARRGTVLVVEDEPRVRKFAARCLSEAGYDVLEADCGSRALEILEQQYDIDLVFSDIAMPGGMTGRELAQVIGDKYPYIVVKLTTGFEPNSEPGNQRSSILRKPYTRTDLMHYLEP